MTKARFNLTPFKLRITDTKSENFSKYLLHAIILLYYSLVIRIRPLPLKYNNPTGEDNGENT